MADATVQARIDSEFKREIQRKCIDENIKIATVIVESLHAFVEHGKWWEPESETDAIKADLQRQGLYPSEEP